MATNGNKMATTKLTVLEAKSLLVKTDKFLSVEIKDAIIQALAQDVRSTLAEARHLWAKKKPLTKEQSALLLEWMWTQVDHTKGDSEKLVLTTKAEPAPQSQAAPVHNYTFGAPSGTQPLFGSPAPCSPGPTRPIFPPRTSLMGGSRDRSSSPYSAPAANKQVLPPTGLRNEKEEGNASK